MDFPDHVSALGHKHIMNIIDNYSSFVWTIPLKAKSDAYLALLAWEQACELETSLKVGIYCLDNGELTQHNRCDWLLSYGTQHQFTAPHTSVLCGLHNQISSSAHSSVVRGQVELWTLGSSTSGNKKLVRLRSLWEFQGRD